jgi:hypothetical protein
MHPRLNGVQAAPRRLASVGDTTLNQLQSTLAWGEARSASPNIHFHKAGIVLGLLGGTLALAAAAYALRGLLPIGVDWREIYAGLSFWWPYAAADFFNPPWLLVLLPHAWLPLSWGNALNFLLNVAVPCAVIFKFKGGWKAIALVFTSPFYIQLIATNNVDWVPLLAFLVPAQWSLPLLLTKPQAVGGAALVYLRRSRGRALLPALGVIGFSAILWPGWWTALRLPPLDAAFNIAPFPLLAPLGLYALYRAWHSDDETLAAAATPLLVPYVAPYALTATMTVLSCRHPRLAAIIWLVMWWHVGIAVRVMLF